MPILYALAGGVTALAALFVGLCAVGDDRNPRHWTRDLDHG